MTHRDSKLQTKLKANYNSTISWR